MLPHFTLPILSLVVILLSSPPFLHAAVEICPYFSCNRHRHDSIQFPFRVPRNQTFRCGYPGFDLSCNSNDETLLNLPSSNSREPLTVQGIDYSYQLLWLTDPNHCVPDRILKLNLSGSSYGLGPNSMEYSFLNCSKLVDPSEQLPSGTSVISCLSKGNFTVVAAAEKEVEEKMVSKGNCKLIKRVVAPLWWPEIPYVIPDDISDVFIQLSWDIPGCRDCALRGGSCGFASDSGLTIGCFLSGGNGGIPNSIKYGLLLGAGIPGLVCMIGLTFYISGRVRAYNQHRRHRQVSNEALPAIFPQPMILRLGLDGPTIESYPKTVLGESRRLPKPSDFTCPICLSEYLPKDTLRSIPECNHYFHSDCIDEWLRMNATCPLCRNSPQNQKFSS